MDEYNENRKPDPINLLDVQISDEGGLAEEPLPRWLVWIGGILIAIGAAAVFWVIVGI